MLTGAACEVCIIQAGGWGTRFLPFSRFIPKELLPLGGVPAIELVVQECLRVGFARIIVVTRPGDSLIRQHLTSGNLSLGEFLSKPGSRVPVHLCQGGYGDVLEFVEEDHQLGYGNGVPLLQLRDSLPREGAVALAFADDVILGSGGLPELIEAYKSTVSASAVCMQRVVQEKLPNFGNVVIGQQLLSSPPTYDVQEIIQKPGPEQVRSPYALVSRLIIHTQVITQLSRCRWRGEVDIGSTLSRSIAEGMNTISVDISGEWVTVGDPESYADALQLCRSRPRLISNTFITSAGGRSQVDSSL